MFHRFVAALGVEVDVVILDINGAVRRAGSWHLKNRAIDFCFAGMDFEWISPSSFVRAAGLAGFRGAGVYYGDKKKSYHLDFGDRTAFWLATKKNKRWVYTYFNRRG